MENIRVLIVEDRLLIAEDIAVRLRRHGLDIAAVISSGEEAVAFVKESKPDLVLMDIELAGAMDGISAAQVIHEHDGTPVIYLSEFSDKKTFERAKKTQPANYLTKPFNEHDLVRAIDIAFHNDRTSSPLRNSQPLNYLFVRLDNQVYKKVMIDDILYLKADRAYSRVVTDSSEYVLSTSMNHVFEQLPSSGFMKVHRSYIVNVKRITDLDGNVVVLGNMKVQMSSEHRDGLLAALKILK